MLPKPLRMIWGSLTISEAKRFGLLSIALMLTVGPYWMLRVVREALFIDLVGVRWQPWGKIASVIFVIPLVLIYSKLIDLVKKEKLFYVIYFTYALLFLSIACIVEFPQYFLSITSTHHLVAWIPGKVLGWISYVIIESFGALAPALFWSFVASYTTTRAAKRGYGMILSMAQIGTISGTLFIAHFSERLGLPIIIVIATFFITIVPFVIRRFLMMKDVKTTKFLRKNKEQTGFWEGIRLLLKQPYLLGIFVITTGYEITGTFLEFQMNILGHQKYPTKEMFAAFYGSYGFYTNMLAFLFALMGTSFFLRKFGLRICLLLFPAATGIIILSARVFPVLPVIFVSMIILKGLSYSLNNPSKEILYIPTSRDAKFKAKGWIDVFGARSVKASGSGINAFFRKLAPPETIAYAAPILLGFVSGWLIVARLMGVKHHTLIENKEIIE